MQRGSGVALALCLAVSVTAALSLGQSSKDEITGKGVSVPGWAYPVASGARVQPQQVNRGAMHVPGSSAAYTSDEIADLMRVPDWFPDSHPPTQGIVSHGREPGVYACAYCHLPNGLGRPENASVAGLPEGYILQQMADFKSGARRSSEPHMMPVNYMIGVAKGATPEEMEQGAAYFSALKLTPWIRVVETDVVPRTRVAGAMLVVSEAGGTEPIGERVIEVPEDLEQTELRNSKSGFVAYVPTGSLKRGAALVDGGGGKKMPCASCHGPDLRGAGDIPSIAGRSPSQMARQIMDFRSGARNGAGAKLMKPTVAGLTDGDVVAITGYLASLQP